MLYLTSEIRDIEQRALAQTAAFALMHRAATAVAQYVRSHILHPHSHILILVGPGNNGGDALETAAQLSQQYNNVTVLYSSNHTRQGDAATAFTHTKNTVHAIHFVEYEDFTTLNLSSFDVVIDGLFGIGLKRPIDGILNTIINAINQTDCPVIAIDIASGLNADTGTIVQHNGTGVAIHADTTITFIGDKTGLHTCDGIDISGNIIVDTLHIPDHLLTPSKQRLSTPNIFDAHFKKRSSNSHKGSFGDVLIIGGSHGMAGAPVLAARSALHAGAGRVFAAFESLPFAYDPIQPELMLKTWDTIQTHRAVLVIGPGLGTSDTAKNLLTQLLTLENTIVLDADALNLISQNNNLKQLLQNKEGHQVLMTPHPLEAARLLGISAKEVQNDRLSAARSLASQYQAYIILKGAGTVIASPSGQCWINPTGNPALATAGSGDVLSGLCGALLAQHIPLELTAIAAPWIHGKAADNLVNEEHQGPAGISASELFIPIRSIINQFSKN